MTLRFEIFPDDLDATVDFYMRVLRFRLIADRRDEPRSASPSQDRTNTVLPLPGGAQTTVMH